MSRVTTRPLFITIGAMKSGTSSLHHYMRMHPEIHMSWVKETNHFLRPRPPLGGTLRYRLLLAGPGRVVGETSPNYTKALIFPGVAARMHAAAPHARLIYILRDPVARAISHYHHNRLHGRVRRPVEAAFASDAGNKYIDTSRYRVQLEEYLRFYSPERILILDFAELVRRPRDVMRRVFGFVGVDAGFSSPGFHKVFHDSGRKRQPNALGRLIHDVPLVRRLRYALPPVFEKPLARPEVGGALGDRIGDWVREDAERVREFSGLPFETWSV